MMIKEKARYILAENNNRRIKVSEVITSWLIHVSYRLTD